MTTRKGEATRSRILDAAVDVLVRGGRSAVNLDEILATTRTSKGQLFHYFPGGKHELIRAATERQLERLAVESAEPLDGFESWRRWIDGLVARHRLQTRDDACEVAALAGRVLDRDADERDLLGARFDAWRARLEAGLFTMRHAGVLRPDAPVPELAALVVAAVQGGAVVDKATGRPDALESALRAAFAYLESFATTP